MARKSVNDIRFHVEEVVRDFVADIPKAHSTKHGNRGKPIPVKHKMHELVQKGRENGSYRGWHDNSILIHWEIVMKTMEKKVHGNTNTIIRKIPITLN